MRNIDEIIDCARFVLSDILPSEWCESNRMMTSDVSPIPGLFRYDNSPYTREIVDCLAPSHPSRIVAVQKAAQIGFSTSVIEAAIGWIIAQSQGNILFLVGHDDLVKDAMNKVDRMIDNTGIRPLIKSSAVRVRNTKSGDTDSRKDFAGGYLKLGTANHKTLRNISMQYGFIDDFESMKGDTKQSGSTKEMIEQRFAAFASKMKLLYISTPEIKATSNIEPVYLLGDQRKYHLPCPCCTELIRLEWAVKSEKNAEEMAGMTWKLDENGELIQDSVGYICYKCGGFFDDTNKTELLKLGVWVPTARPSQPGYYSYHISALYAPTYMFGWAHYVRKYIEANPLGGQRDEKIWKTFVNLVLGETYEPAGEGLKATELQMNVRPYDVGSVPEKLSLADGNGKIVLLTCGTDMNGKEDDARLDYSIRAWSETGVTYSVTHGSVGTFIPKDPGKVDRVKWTYRKGQPNNVWTEFDKIIGATYKTDTERGMMIMMTGLDTGYLNVHAYPYIDSSNFTIVGLKGDKDKYSPIGIDKRTFKQSVEKVNLFLVEANVVKDVLSSKMNLKWSPDHHEVQPPGFLNFPLPSGGKYLYTNYFSHFEAEHRTTKDGKWGWQKKSANHQNHLFDCECYNEAVKDILLWKLFKELKIQNGVWNDFVNIILGRRK